MLEPVRCGKTDLIVGHCAHCRETVTVCGNCHGEGYIWFGGPPVGVQCVNCEGSGTL